MSRSYKHSPCGKTTGARSEKGDKQASSRNYRRACKIQIHLAGDEVDLGIIVPADPWNFAGDGKYWWGGKPWVDPEKSKKSLRK